MTLLGIAFGVAVVIVLLAGALSPLLVFVAVMERGGEAMRPLWRWWVGSGVLSFACIVLGAYMLVQGGGDEARHCAAGTRYVEQNRVVGKTIEHDWACVPA